MVHATPHTPNPSCAISLAAGALFGLVPILRVPLAEMLAGLKEGGRTSAGITWRRFGANLVVAEVAVAMVLLVGAGLFAKSLFRGYFATPEARLSRGHYFDDAEDESKPPVVIVNRTMAKQYFRGEDPIGKEIAFVMFTGPLDTAARPVLYVPFNQSPIRFFSVVVRTSEAEQPLLPSLSAAIHRINSAISIHGEATMTERINDSPSAYLHRSSTWLVGGFVATAFLLSMVALYGVVAYSVSRRTREIGIRMALGAESKSVYKLILGEAAWLGGAGTALGLVCSIAAATLIRRLLFGVDSWDVPTLASVAAVLAISALLAS